MSTMVRHTDTKPQGDLAAREEDSQRSWDCVLIYAHGKSGTKRVLRLLDLSPRSHCRNEPEIYSNSGLRALRRKLKPFTAMTDACAETLEADWDAAIAQAGRCLGYNDRLPPVRKEHLGSVVQCLRLMRWAHSARLARLPLWRASGQSKHGREWCVPGWARSMPGWRQRLPVMKVGAPHIWGEWLVDQRPRQRIVHVLRHPAAFLHSWWHRVAVGRDIARIRKRGRRRMTAVAEQNPDWAKRLGDRINAMEVFELELWNWRFQAETMYCAGQGHPSYEVVIDEQLAADPLREAKRLYEACGLSWTSPIEQAVAEQAPHWQAHRFAWRDLVQPEIATAVERVMADSPLRELWPADAVVSDHTYTIR